ncbi:Pre-mRNA-splicing factor ATP-dependent RNA helicase DEAH1 [Linum perenne]
MANKRRITSDGEEEGSRSSSDEEKSLLLRDRDERDQLDRNIRERDANRRKRRKDDNDLIRRAEKKNNDVDLLRKLSRREYLTKREQRKVEELRDLVEDEMVLFRDVELTEREIRDRKLKEDLLEVLEKKKVPEEDEDQEKRFAIANQRYREDSDERRKKKNEQEAWEDHQIGKGTLKFGSLNKHKMNDDYELLIENPIKFVMKSVIDGDDQVQIPNDNRSKWKSEKEKLQEVRKSLPIYLHKKALLDAIEKFQILIIVGETGSGKTTQITQYLHEAGYTKLGKKIGCTQPRRVAAMSVAARVSQEMGAKLGQEVGYSIRFEDNTSEKTVIKYMTDGMLLREFLGEPDLASYSVMMLDEAHERTISTDILFGLMKDVARHRPDLRLLISSATLDAKKFSDFFDSAPIYSFPGRRYPVQIYYTPTPEADYLDAAIVTALQIHCTEPLGGDILVFLSGQDEIELVEEELRCRIKGLRIAELIICPLRTMKRARDVRDQLLGLLDRVEIDLVSSFDNLDSIKKAVVSGYFPNSARMEKDGSYKTVKCPKTVYMHPGSGLARSIPRWVVYHELVLTTKEYMRQVTELKPEWLVEIAPHFYRMKDVEDSGSKKKVVVSSS